MSRRFGILFVAFLAFASVTLVDVDSEAHHSFAMFDFTKVVTFKGTVKEYAWSNPHVLLWFYVDPVKDGEPRAVWWAELTSPGNLTRMGWSKHSFKANEPIEVQIDPLRMGPTAAPSKKPSGSRPARSSRRTSVKRRSPA